MFFLQSKGIKDVKIKEKSLKQILFFIDWTNRLIISYIQEMLFWRVIVSL